MADPAEIPAEIVSLDVRHFYGGDVLPPGAIAVEDRVLAHFVTPGATRIPHGVVPIGSLGLPRGDVLTGEDDDCADEIMVLPFRFAWFSSSYALRYGNNVYAIVRNVQPQQVSVGMCAVVQLNDNKNWECFFGRVKKIGLASLAMELPNGDEKRFTHADIHFVGRVSYWWLEGVKTDMWVGVENVDENDPQAARVA